MPERSLRYAVRLLFALALAIALHIPLLLAPEKPAGGRRVPISAAVDLQRDMKDLGQALAALEKKAAAEAPPPPEAAEKSDAPEKAPSKEAAPTKSAEAPKAAEPVVAAATQPLTTPKTQESKLPPRPDAAPPPPPGSGVPDVKPPEHTTYKEAEREKGNGAYARGPAGGDPKPAQEPPPEPVRAPEPPPPAPAPVHPPAPPPPPPVAAPTPPPQPAPAPKPPPPPADPQPTALAHAKPAEVPAQPGDVAYARPAPASPRTPAGDGAASRRAAASPAAPASVPAGGDSSAAGVASPVLPPSAAPSRSSGAPSSPQTHAASGAPGQATGHGGGGVSGDPGDKGLEVPTIHLEPWASKDELISICAYFGMPFVLVPDTRNYFVIVQLASGRYDVRKDFEYFDRFANRDYQPLDAIAEDLRRKVARDLNVDAEHLSAALLFPQKTADFLAWKELAVARKAGCAQGTVESVLARFVRTDEGKWILFIEELRLKDGRRIACGEAENAVPN